jgi:outer membrane murein-binding lipoprotein Lpp
MSQHNDNEIDISLSQSEKQKLKKILEESQRHTALDAEQLAGEISQEQSDRLTRRMADLTEMILKLDSQMDALKTAARLSHQKSERLNQRLDAVIHALKNS